MKILIIYAHPKTEGYGPTILDETKKILKRKNMNYEVIDLYGIKYDPVLNEKEHSPFNKNNLSKETLHFQNMIKEADLQIYIYPIWWASMPAILKGFFDRVFTSHFAFQYKDGRHLKLLKGKKAIVMTTCGAPWFFYKYLARAPIWIIKNGILGFCGIKTKVNLLGNCIDYNKKKEEKIKRFVRKSLKF